MLCYDSRLRLFIMSDDWKEKFNFLKKTALRGVFAKNVQNKHACN